MENTQDIMTVQMTIPAPDRLPEQLHLAWGFLVSYPPVLALTVLLGGLLAALGVRGLILLLGRRITAREPGGQVSRLLRIAASESAVVLAYLALVLAVQLLGLNERLEQLFVRILSSLLILRLIVVGLRAGRLGLEFLGRIRQRFPIVEERTIPLLDLVMTVLVVGLASYALLMVWSINPAAWLASAGVVGIAVGFAARDTLANLFAGFFIIADAPYKLGDYVVLGTGERGEVTKVGVRSTRILTRDDVEITVPNSVMANSQIYNESGGKWERFRIRIKVCAAYGSDAEAVVGLLESIAFEHATVCPEPRPRVRLRGFGHSGLDFELLCWVDYPADRGRVSHELYLVIYKAFDAAGITIPRQQHDVWMRGGEAPDSST